MIMAETMAIAPDRTIGIRSQMIPVMPPAKVRATAPLTAPIPKIVATIPATEVLDTILLIVPLVIACS